MLLCIENLTLFSYFVHIVVHLTDNQDTDDWRDDEDKMPGHENMTEKDVELFRHIQQLALQVGSRDISTGSFPPHPDSTVSHVKLGSSVIPWNMLKLQL